MFIEFKVSNFRSIESAQTLSLVASSGKELLENIAPSDFSSGLSLVRSAVIYGPNASGKTNLIRSLSFVRRFIISSAKESQAGEKIPVTPFLFSNKNKEEDSKFEITFSQDGVRYQYGFSVNTDRVLEEWLLAYPQGRVQQWFLRTYDDKKKKYDWEFSKLFKGVKQQVADLTRPEVLFLSNAVKLNNEQLLPVFNWFQNDLFIIAATNELDVDKTVELIKDPSLKKEVMKYLAVADPTITDISLEFEKFTEDKLPKGMPQELRDILKKNMLGKDLAKIDFVHNTNSNLSIGEESQGTKKFFAMAGFWIKALAEGKVIIVDELDNSLHSLAVRFLLGLFNNPTVNKKNAQLIFSTHDTSLLDNDLLRRDQVWFVEKDKKNSSQLYPLLDFSPRKNESIGKGYLQGRYGALPYVGDWRF